MEADEVHFDLVADYPIHHRIIGFSLVNHYRLKPTAKRMVRIHTVVELDILAWLPLNEDPWGVDGDRLIVTLGPPRVMHVDFVGIDTKHFSINPFVHTVLHVKVLPHCKHCVAID